MEQELHPICYGSLITLKTPEDFYLCAQGFIDHSPFLQRNISSDFSGAVFRIVPQSIFSVQNELISFVQEIKEQNLHEKVDRLAKLEDSLEGEIKTNMQRYLAVKGTPIKYDSPVQLEHLQSHKFLTLECNDTADIEKENLKVSLEDFTSARSHFRIVPGYNYQRFTDGVIKNTDKVHLEIMVSDVRKTAFLHSSRSYSDEILRNGIYSLLVLQEDIRNYLEVNISFDQKTRWEICEFSSSADEDAYLECGDYIWITKPEESVFLSVTSKEGMDTHRKRLMFTSNVSDTNGLWMVENAEASCGGLIEIFSGYRLRHISSRHYLGVNSRNQLVLSEFIAPGSLWTFVPLEPDGKYMRMDEISLIINADTQRTINVAPVTYEITTSPYEHSDILINEEAVYKITRASGEVVWETLFLLHCSPILAGFRDFVSDSLVLEGPDASKKIQDFKKKAEIIDICISKIIQFCKNKLQGMIGIDKHLREVQLVRQKMLKEHNFFEILANMLESALPEPIPYEQIRLLMDQRERGHRRKKSIIGLDLDLVRLKSVSRIVENIYHLLKTLCYKNQDNQSHAYGFFPIFFKHLGTGLGASEFILSVLKDNEQLMLSINSLKFTQGGANCIEHFSKLLHQGAKEIRVELLDFFKNICVFKGQGITVNQEKVFSCFFRGEYDAELSRNVVIERGSLCFVVDRVPVPVDSFFEKNRIAAFDSEAMFFTKLLELYGNMCIGRNFEVSAKLIWMFPFELIHSLVWNSSLTNEIRGAFCRLLLNLYVDCSPREEVKKPQLIKEFRFFEQNLDFSGRQETMSTELKKRTDMVKVMDEYGESVLLCPVREKAGDCLPPSQDDVQIYKLLEKIFEYFEPAPTCTELTCEILRLTSKLLKFEMLGANFTDFEKERLIQNPRMDHELDIVRILKAVVPLLCNVKVENTFARYNRRRSTKIEMAAQKDNNKKQMVYLSSLLQNSGGLKDPVIRSSANLKNSIAAYKQNPFTSIENKSIESRIMHKICRMLVYYFDCRQEFFLNNFVSWFNSLENKENLDERHLLELLPQVMGYPKEQKQFSEYFSGIYGQAFVCFKGPFIPDLNSLSSKSLIFCLLDIFVDSRNYKLQSIALLLILRCYQQRKEMLKNLGKIHPISNVKDTEMLSWLRSNVKSFKGYSERSEVWISYWKSSSVEEQEDHFESFQAILVILKNLEAVLHEKTHIEAGTLVCETDSNLSHSRQKMANYLGIDQLILALIKDGIHELVAIYNSSHKKEYKEQLEMLFRKCLSFLTKFVTKHPQNQKKIHKNLHIFFQNMNLELGQIPLICEIFRENLNLIERIDEEFLQIFRNLIVKYGRRPIFLEFYKVVQVVKGKPVPSIQRIILNMFIKEDLDLFLLYMCEDPPYEFSFKLRESENSEYSDEPYAYHATLLDVLAQCGFGVTGMYFNEAKCQNIIRLSIVFKILFAAEDKSSPFSCLKIPMLSFFYNIYLDCEIISIELKTCASFFDYILLQSKVLEDSPAISKDHIEFLSLFLKILLQYRLSYIKKHDTICKDSSAIQAFIDSLLRNSLKFENLVLPKSFLQTINDLCDSFGINFSFAADESDISLEESESLKRTCTNKLLTEESPALKSWEDLCTSLSHSEVFKAKMHAEEQALVLIIHFAGRTHDSLSFEKIMGSLIQFIHLSRSQHPALSLVLNAIELLARVLANPIHDQFTERQEAKMMLQNTITGYGLVRVVFTLMCDNYVDMEIFKSLMTVCIELLDGGNEFVQSEIYFFFNNTANSEVFFERIHQIFVDYIDKIAHSQNTMSKIPKAFKKRYDDIRSLLRLLQLFCEGHNLSLQNYIRLQTKSRNSYDMISDTISLLEILIEKKLLVTFHVISQCLDTLTEFIQGPCMKNQESIIDGKFLELASTLLALDENSSNCTTYEIIKKAEFLDETLEKVPSEEEDPKCWTGWMVAHIKYKCMITILSLVEGRTDTYVITRLTRAFNIEILKENLKSIYIAYVGLYKSKYYNNNIFNHTKDNDQYIFGIDTNKQDLKPAKYSLVIETGFMIYHLLKIFLESEDPESQEIIATELEQLYQLKEQEEFTKTPENIKKIYTELSDEAIRHSISSIKYYTTVQELEVHKEICYSSTFKFFDKYTGKIEVIFHDNIFRVYFPLPAEFRGLTPEIKEKFHRNVDRDTDQTKLKYLLVKAESIIEQIQHEHKLLNLIQNNKFISLFASKVYIWREIAFVLTIALNLCVLLSYSIYHGNLRMDEPALLNLTYYATYLDSPETMVIIKTLGITQLVCCIIIVIFFLLKVGPIVAKKGWRTHAPTVEYLKSKPNTLIKYALKIKQIIWTVAYVLKNFPVLYHIAYTIFSVLGIFTHPFYFSLLLLDILYKYPSLQNVVKSFIVPYKALALTFCMMIVVMYLFAILGYLFFQNDFGIYCDTLYWCTITLWDGSFKVNGAIGGFMDQFEDGAFHMARFFYDNVFNILLNVIIMGIVEGLIIDTFAVLREEQEKSNTDRETKCFICGLERDFIERKTNMPFSHHTEVDHNEWNYIFFIAHLLRKDETEYTGLESYVRQQYDNQELAWIPNHRTFAIKDIAHSEEAESLYAIEKINQRLKSLEEQVREMRAKQAET